MTLAAIRTARLTRDYGRLRALDALDLVVPRGRVVALLGPNGAGKTTLLRLLAGLIEPTAGEAEILGAPSRDLPPEVAGRLAVMGEGVEPPGWAALGHLADLQAGAVPAFDRALARRLWAARELSPRRAYGSLSKGQKRWALAALVLASGAGVLLLDEPADGLDPAARRDLYDHVRDYVTQEGATALVATHIIADIERVADDVAVIDRGRLVLHAALEQLREEVRELELPAGAALPQFGADVHLLGRREAAGALLVWVRCGAADARRLERLLPAPAAVRTVDLETLYLAIAERRPAGAEVLEKEAV